VGEGARGHLVKMLFFAEVVLLFYGEEFYFFSTSLVVERENG